MSDTKSKISVKLKIVKGPNQGQEFTFHEQDTFTLGRANDCSCVVYGDSTCSQHHMVIEINNGHVTLKNRGSSNGTYVNGICYGKGNKSMAREDAEPSKAVALYDGAEIKAGRNVMVLTIDAPALCVDCGEDIPWSARRAAKFIYGTYLCQTCRHQEEERLKKPKPIERKEDVHMNVEQRKNAEGDSAGIIAELFEEFSSAGKKQNRPLKILGYRNLKKLGQGRFGTVYKAERVSDGEAVAVETMQQSRKITERQIMQFKREKQFACQLDHPNIVRTNKVYIWNDIHFSEMEFIEGNNISNRMQKRCGKLCLEEADPIMIDVLEGLAFAHKAEITIATNKSKQVQHGVVHRNLTPSNIILAKRNGKEVAKISDFRLARSFGISRMSENCFAYMAREHIVNFRKVMPLTDVFEVAAVFFQMISGVTVWPMGPGRDPCKVILESEPRHLQDHLPSAPSRLYDLFDQALNIDTSRRYQDGGEFLQALKQVI